MIDAVVNTQTGPAIIHDEPGLEGARAFLLGPRGACSLVRSDGTRRAIAMPLEADMADAFGAVDACPLIRLDGNRVASHRSVPIVILERTSE